MDRHVALQVDVDHVGAAVSTAVGRQRPGDDGVAQRALVEDVLVPAHNVERRVMRLLGVERTLLAEVTVTGRRLDVVGV